MSDNPFQDEYQKKLKYNRDSALFLCRMMHLYGLVKEAEHLAETILCGGERFEKTMDASIRLLEMERSEVLDE